MVATNRRSVPEMRIDTIAALLDGRMVEVENIVDFLRQRHREDEAASAHALWSAALLASEATFATVWNSLEDELPYCI